MEEAKRVRVQNENIHFNFYSEPQYGIPNFPQSLSEIAVNAVSSSKLKNKCLVVGCGAGRCVIEMAKHKHIGSVDGIDGNPRLIAAANGFKTKQSISWEIPNHGSIMDSFRCAAFKDLKCDKTVWSKCQFRDDVKDYHTIPFSYKNYDCVVVCNVLDRLHSPKKFVNSMQRKVVKGGTLVLSECFDWKESITQKAKWIGGSGKQSSSEALKGMLKMFTLVKEDKISFIERENAFLFRLRIANTFIFRKK